MKFERRSFLMLSALSLAAAVATPAANAARIGGSGHVYTMTNAAAGNDVMVYERGAHGALALAQTVSTAGLGTGAGLGSQGSVTLSQDGRWLFVVNGGSGTVSTFSVGGKSLTLVANKAKVWARGPMPPTLDAAIDFLSSVSQETMMPSSPAGRDGRALRTSLSAREGEVRWRRSPWTGGWRFC